MLGLYKQFPPNVHKTAHYATSISNKRLQQTLIQVLHKINNETYRLEDIAPPSLLNCMVVFECGIAETDSFHYLDEEETNKVLETIRKKPLQIIDLFCSLRFYKMQSEKRISLRFDYYMIRFAFSQNLMRIQFFHERGPRHMAPEDIASFMVDKINGSFSRKVLKPFKSS
jgi:hypothetical protein